MARSILCTCPRSSGAGPSPIGVATRTIYREEGVAEYGLVDLDARTIERSTPSAPHVQVMADRLTWLPGGAAAPLELDVAVYFARVLDD